MLKNKIGQFNKNDTLMVIGANHRSSTMLLRDQLYIPSADLPVFYKRLKDNQKCFCSDSVRDFLDIKDE